MKEMVAVKEYHVVVHLSSDQSMYYCAGRIKKKIKKDHTHTEGKVCIRGISSQPALSFSLC